MSVKTASDTRPGDHAVRFYEHEDDLVDTVRGYLAEPLRSGDVAIVVATAGHRRAFEAALAGAGLDVAALRAGGSLVVADAGELLARFMVDGAPDAAAFDAVVGELVRQAGRTGRRVRVYGEMVALLWDAGYVTAAIELETLWNRLGARTPFSLLCAYPSASVAGDGHAAAFGAVCDLHTEVVDPGRPSPVGTVETRRFAPSSHAPGDARRFVAESLRGRVGEDLVADAALVVTELATNAVVHAGSDFVVSVRRAGDVVEVRVRDGSRSSPAPGGPGPAATSGRGLALVGAIASRWGHEPVDEGKVVWAELRG